MKLLFLGTAAGSPSRQRNVTSMALIWDDGRVWLFDCGEGTQHQILRSSIKPARIEKIFITHFHGDHWYGLPGIIASLKVHGRSDDVEIYAPEGLEKVICGIFSLSNSEHPFQKNFKSFASAGDKWLLDCGTVVQCVPIEHSIPSYAYLIQEKSKPGRFRIEQLQALGCDDTATIKELAEGRPVEVAGNTLNPADFRDQEPEGVRLAILGDTCDATSIADVWQKADWLVHEATYDASFHEKALQFKHATSEMAGSLAAKLCAKNLILTHFSARYESDAKVSVATLVAEAQQQCPETKVHAAEDFLEFDLRKS